MSIFFSYSHKDNIVLNDASSESAVLESVLRFAGLARRGWGDASSSPCLVENSTQGLRRKTGFLVDVAEKTGVHIVAGTGKENRSFTTLPALA